MKYTPISDVLMVMRPGRLPEAPRVCQIDYTKQLPVLISGCPGGKGDLLIMNSFSSRLRHFIRKVSLGWGLSNKLFMSWSSANNHHYNMK